MNLPTSKCSTEILTNVVMQFMSLRDVLEDYEKDNEPVTTQR
jgi:hypothetical protein